MLTIPKAVVILSDGSYRHWAPRGGTTLTVLDSDGTTELEVALDPDEDPPTGLPYVLDSDGVTKLYLAWAQAVYSMNLTTLTRVKASLGGISSSAHDTLLTNIIESVSARIERYMRRQVLRRTLTETVALSQYSTVYSLDTAPITSITSIKYVSHPSDAATATALDARNYTVENAAAGMLRLFFDASTRSFRIPGYLVVNYTAGMADDTADFVATYPDIAHAADLQVTHEFQRRNSPGGNATSDTASTSYTGDLELLASVKQTLEGHRRAYVR